MHRKMHVARFCVARQNTSRNRGLPRGGAVQAWMLAWSRRKVSGVLTMAALSTSSLATSAPVELTCGRLEALRAELNATLSRPPADSLLVDGSRGARMEMTGAWRADSGQGVAFERWSVQVEAEGSSQSHCPVLIALPPSATDRHLGQVCERINETRHTTKTC
mmetsp:Transcript_55247/g.152078  ORF Transcript_55247/g.152078 Transcript_55247/m.152078 type:complete len:163 (-) Transcript_55247:85-573(-)